MSNIIITVDTEGTGIDVKKDRVAEIAAVAFDLDTKTIVGTYHQQINPGVPMPEAAFEVHGLSDELLKDKPTLAEVIDDFYSFVAGAHVVIHNARYDVGILDAECKRHKLQAFSEIPAKISDSLASARFAFPAKKNTLDALCDRLGVDRSARTLHGALVDCELLAKVYPELMKAVEARESLVSTLLPQSISAPFPDSLDERVRIYLAVTGVLSSLEKYKEKLRADILSDVPPEGIAGDSWEISFSKRGKTDWDGIAKKHLENIDLSEFKSETSITNISEKS